MKRIFFSIILIFYVLSLSAQETRHTEHESTLFEKGTYFFEQGLYLQSREFLNDFLSLSPETIHEKSKIMEAEFMLAKGALFLDLTEGELLLSRFSKKYAPEKKAQEALLGLADYYFASKVYQEAIAYYSQIDTAQLNDTEKHTLLYKRGYAYFVKNDTLNSYNDFKKIKSKENDYQKKANYYLGIISFKNGKYEQALDFFENAKGEKEFDEVVPYYQSQIHFALQDYNNVILVGTKALQSKKITTYETEINQLVGKAFFEKEKYNDALPYFENFERDAEELRAQDLYQVAYTRYKTRHYDKAIQTFEELKNVKSELGQNSLFILANSYLKKGDKTSARNAFAGASRLSYDRDIQKESNFQYGKLSYDQGFDRDAISAFQRIGSASKHYLEAQKLLTTIFLNTQDYDRAMSLIESMPEKTPDMEMAYQKITYLKGVELFNDNKFDDSKKYLNISIDNSVDDILKALAIFRIGEIYHKEENYYDSSRNFLKFNELARNTPNLPMESSLYMSDYILGYNYLKMKEYLKASIHFDNSIQGIIDKWKKITSNDIKNRVFPDAILRAGDSHFNKNNYKDALSYYQTSINYKYQGYDYALFQKARILGVQGHKIDQIAALETLNTELPNSPYIDDALYLLGRTYFREGNYDKAEVVTYELVTKHKETSNLINKGYLLLGLINYNQNELENALKYYEATAVKNPTEGEMTSALKSIEEIYVDMNNPEGFIDFKERVLGQEVTNDDKENLVFKSGELQYEAGNIEGAIGGYTKYINQYPNGKYILQAYYNRAESHLFQKNYPSALLDYEFVIAKGNSGLYEKALTKASNISYNYLENFEKAYNHYAALSKVASDEDKKLEANLGALRSAYRINLTDGIYDAADNVINHQKATEAQKATAHFFKAKTAMTLDDYDIALTHFRVAAKQSNVQGAESRYQISYIYYLQRELNIARELCMAHLKTSKNYETWVAKGLLLLSDIAFEQGDLFNARAALETLIENYKSDKNPNIIEAAKEKLSIISELESDESRIIPEE